MLNKIFKTQIVKDTEAYCKMMDYSEYTTELLVKIACNLPRNTDITPAKIAVSMCANEITLNHSQDCIYGRKG